MALAQQYTEDGGTLKVQLMPTRHNWKSICIMDGDIERSGQTERVGMCELVTPGVVGVVYSGLSAVCCSNEQTPCLCRDNDP